jgi:hypothetical protein
MIKKKFAWQVRGSMLHKDGRIFTTSSLYLVLTMSIFSLSSSANSQLSNSSVELAITREYSSSSILPITNEYVQYAIKVENVGPSPIENELLWVQFVSEHGKSDVSVNFSIGKLESGQSKIIQAGPFKMRELGRHSLFLGINQQGNAFYPNDLTTNADPNTPIDSFTVYEPSLVQISSIAIPSIFIGAAFLVALAIHKRKQRRRHFD